MKELESTQLNSLALQITVAIFIGDSDLGQYPRWTLALSGRAFAPKPCQGPV